MFDLIKLKQKHLVSNDKLVNFISNLRPKLLVTVGAGDITKFSHKIKSVFVMSKKILKNLVFLLSLCLFLSIFFLEKRKSHINEIEIKYKNNNKEYINEPDLMIQINKFFNSNSLKDINTRLLEDSLNALTNVKNAEVYLSLNNNLTVLIQQETPFIGIKNSNERHFFTKR